MPQSRNNGPHSETEMDRLTSFSSGVDKAIDELENLSLNNLPKGTGLDKLIRDRASLLHQTLERVDRPIIKSLARDMLNIMGSWFQDPEVLCCLVQAVWSMYQDSKQYQQERPPELNFVIQDTKFAEFLDGLISFIDFIMVFISEDIQKISIFIPDFMKEIMSAVMGAILLVIQETSFSLRDSILETVLDWIDENSDNYGDQLWARCVPFMQLTNILKKYVHDYGILASLFEKIKGYVSEMAGSFGAISGNFGGPGIVENVGDLEYLKWFRDLLIQLKRTVISFDLCVQYQFIPDPINTNEAQVSTGNTVANNPNLDAAGEDPRLSKEKVTIIQHDDGTVSLNNRPDPTQKGDQGNGLWVSQIAASSIKKLGAVYGFPEDVMNQAYARYTDGDLGTVLNPDGGSINENICAGSPGAQQILSYFKSGFNRNIYRKI